jgi:hypothetical protein
MLRKNWRNTLFVAGILGLIVASVLLQSLHGATFPIFMVTTPKPPAQAFIYSIFRTAPLEVAKVFGRAQGCSDASAELIESTARAAIDAGLDPAIAAATVGVESGCNQFAVSSRGAIGIMQIEVKVWHNQFDFAGNVNLFNRDDNLRVGTKIESELIAQYGMAAGIQRYNGLGVDCASCDSGYVSKILTLAGRR